MSPYYLLLLIPFLLLSKKAKAVISNGKTMLTDPTKVVTPVQERDVVEESLKRLSETEAAKEAERIAKEKLTAAGEKLTGIDLGEYGSPASVAKKAVAKAGAVGAAVAPVIPVAGAVVGGISALLSNTDFDLPFEQRLAIARSKQTDPNVRAIIDYYEAIWVIRGKKQYMSGDTTHAPLVMIYDGGGVNHSLYNRNKHNPNNIIMNDQNTKHAEVIRRRAHLYPERYPEYLAANPSKPKQHAWIYNGNIYRTKYEARVASGIWEGLVSADGKRQIIPIFTHL